MEEIETRRCPDSLRKCRIRKYIPAHSYVNINEFSSPSELAKYIDVFVKTIRCATNIFSRIRYTCHYKPPGLAME